MFETFADSDQVEELVNNSDIIAADDVLLQTLADRSESVLEGPIDATPFLKKYEAFANQLCNDDDPSEAKLESIRSTVMSSVNSQYTNLNVHDMAEFREYIRSYDGFGNHDSVDVLQNTMEDDDDFSMFTTLQGEVVYVMEETHSSISMKFILDDGTDEEDEGVQVTVWTRDTDNDELETVACKPEDADRFVNDPVELEQGDTIAIDGVAANLWEDQDTGNVNIDVDTTSSAEVIPIDRDFDLGSSVEEVEYEGTITGVRNTSDVLYKDDDGERDLRIKAFLTPDNGDEQLGIVIHDTEQVEEIIGMTVEEAEELALESIGDDVSQVGAEAVGAVLNKRVNVTALHYENEGEQDDTYAVTDIEFINAEDRVEAALEELEAHADD